MPSRTGSDPGGRGRLAVAGLQAGFVEGGPLARSPGPSLIRLARLSIIHPTAGGYEPPNPAAAPRRLAAVKNVRGPRLPARAPEPPRTPPVLVRQMRGGVVESRHRGSIVEVGIDGAVRRVLGDPDTLVNLRSAVKPFGLVALVEAGGVEEFDLSDAELAIMAGSHSGEDLHVRTLQAVFRRAGVSQQLPGVRLRGRAAGRPDGGPPGSRRRETGAAPPHVLGPACLDAAAVPDQRLAVRGVLAARPSGPAPVRGDRRPGLLDAAGVAGHVDRRLRRADVRLPAPRGGAGLRDAGGPGGDSGRGQRARAWRTRCAGFGTR